MEEHVIEVACPPGCFGGDLITVTFEDTQFEVSVPPDIHEGEIFSVSVSVPPAQPAFPPTESGAAPEELHDIVTALNMVLDALEDHDDDVLDNLVDGNCAEFAEWEAGSEAKLEWHDLFQTYVSECEGLIGEVLLSVGRSPEAVFEAAQAYEGRDERVQKLIKRLLATDDFEVFCKMMRDRYEILEIFNS